MIIGRTASLESTDGTTLSRERRESFERFRRHLWNPEVITYDELLARARFIVERAADRRSSSGAASLISHDVPEADGVDVPFSDADEDDFPF